MEPSSWRRRPDAWVISLLSVRIEERVGHRGLRGEGHGLGLEGVGARSLGLERGRERR